MARPTLDADPMAPAGADSRSRFATDLELAVVYAGHRWTSYTAPILASSNGPLHPEDPLAQPLRPLERLSPGVSDLRLGWPGSALATRASAAGRDDPLSSALGWSLGFRLLRVPDSYSRHGKAERVDGRCPENELS